MRHQVHLVPPLRHLGALRHLDFGDMMLTISFLLFALELWIRVFLNVLLFLISNFLLEFVDVLWEKAVLFSFVAVCGFAPTLVISLSPRSASSLRSPRACRFGR